MAATAVLIVSRPGQLREALAALIGALPQDVPIYYESEGAVAVQTVAQIRPSLVVLNSDLPGEQIAALVRQLRQTFAAARQLVLAGDVWQAQAAKEAGADAVLLKGSPAERLLAEIESLIHCQRA